MGGRPAPCPGAQFRAPIFSRPVEKSDARVKKCTCFSRTHEKCERESARATQGYKHRAPTRLTIPYRPSCCSRQQQRTHRATASGTQVRRVQIGRHDLRSNTLYAGDNVNTADGGRATRLVGQASSVRRDHGIQSWVLDTPRRFDMHVHLQPHEGKKTQEINLAKIVPWAGSQLAGQLTRRQPSQRNFVAWATGNKYAAVQLVDLHGRRQEAWSNARAVSRRGLVWLWTYRHGVCG